MNEPLVYARIDLGAIQTNIRNLKQLTVGSPLFMAVVKANAYGHGAYTVARTALDSGAQWLGVARFHEAMELREAGVSAPILIFGFTPPEAAAELAANNLTATVYGVDMAEALSSEAVKAGVRVRAHLKIDTGMGRVGILTDARRIDSSAVAGSALEETRRILSFKGLEMEGIYTHFAAADSEDKAYAHYQLSEFNTLLNALKHAGMEFPLRHAANSAGIIDIPDAHFDMVRAGIAMYGLYPSLEVSRDRIRLVPAMDLVSRVSMVKTVPKGFRVSYGMTYETRGQTCIASVPVGYADGYPRLLSSRGTMLVNGRRAPIAGRVCMDQTMLDVGHIPGVRQGDPVVVFGRQGDETVSVDELAGLVNTINYELVSSLTARVERRYIGPGTASG